MMSQLKVGFHYHVPAISKDGDIYMPGYLGCFVDSLAFNCGKVVCFLHSPRPEETSHMDYRISASNVEFVDIGPRPSVLHRTLRPSLFTSYLTPYSSELDILLLRGPSPLLPAMVGSSPIPTVLLLVGDYVAGVDVLPQPRWRKEAIRLWSYWNKISQDRATRKSLTFVNSRVLYDALKDKAPNLHEIRTTTLSKDDFFIRSDTCQSKPYHLLYVGRMDRAKGLLQLVQATALLTESGEDVMLDLVGWQERGDPILDEIQALAQEKKIADRVCYKGSRPFGPELFECYKQSDIFVIASLAEGFPRAIWEAMAHSLPVIASRVGSIPAFIEGSAELISPGQVEALAAAINKLIHLPELRQNFIARGRELARGNTLESQVGAMIAKMEAWVETRYG